MTKPRRVFIESPYAGDVKANMAYLGRCMRDAIDRGEVPFASHAIYPLALDDDIPEERAKGIELGEHWRELCHRTVAYTDLGTSGGMLAGIAAAHAMGQFVEYRRLGDGTADTTGDQTEVRAPTGGGALEK